MVAPSADAAISNADAYSTCKSGMCLQYVRTWWEVAARASDAQQAYDEARAKHPGDNRDAPPGAPVFWRHPGGGHGHIGLSLGGGRFRGTDMTSADHVSDQDVSWPTKAWGYPPLGWTEDLNGVDLPLGGDDMPSAEEVADAVWAKTLAHRDISAPAVVVLVDALTGAQQGADHQAGWDSTVIHLAQNEGDAPPSVVVGNTLVQLGNLGTQVTQMQADIAEIKAALGAR